MNNCSMAALVGGADKNFLAEGAIVTSRLQQQRQQTESAHCSQYWCSAGSDVDSGCMRLQPTQSSAHRALAQPKYGLSFFVFTAILVPKKEKKTKMRMSFSAEKYNAKKNKKCVFWRRKYKENEIRSASTSIAASNIASNDVTNYVTRLIIFFCSFYRQNWWKNLALLAVFNTT